MRVRQSLSDSEVHYEYPKKQSTATISRRRCRKVSYTRRRRNTKNLTSRRDNRPGGSRMEKVKMRLGRLQAASNSLNNCNWKGQCPVSQVHHGDSTTA